MPTIPSHVSNAEQIQLIWRLRRNNAAQVWKDAQWTKFDHVCNEEIQQVVNTNSSITQRLDSELTRALALLNSE